jgi:protein involved in sex pheromone biosynthesis
LRRHKQSLTCKTKNNKKEKESLILGKKPTNNYKKIHDNHRDNSTAINSKKATKGEILQLENNSLQAKKEKSKILKCCHCPLEFRFQFHLEMHVNNVHLKINEKKETTLNPSHKESESLKEVETNFRRFSCHVCELDFATRENLKFHVENEH